MLESNLSVIAIQDDIRQYPPILNETIVFKPFRPPHVPNYHILSQNNCGNQITGDLHTVFAI